MVSNSLASCANSSSTAGSSFSLTELTVAVISASPPAPCPCRNVVWKVADSPALLPMIAASRPSMRSSLPTS